jgi:7-keto-8-aminopelargonate synthetase-like enzyme
MTSLEPLRHWAGVSGLWVGTLGGALGHLGAFAVGFAAAAVVVAWVCIEDRTRG